MSLIFSQLGRDRDEVQRIRQAVQDHFNQRGDNRCYLDDLKLYSEVLGIGEDPYVTALPPDADMHESCRRYIQQRQHPDVHGTFPMPDGMTIEQLTQQLQSQPRVCTAIHVENRDGQVLLLKRSPSGRWPGQWCMPGGGLEAGETLQACASRELQEEIGLCGVDMVFSGMTEEIGEDHVVGVVFHTRVDSIDQVQNVEPDKHDEIGWFSLGQLPSPLMECARGYLLRESGYYP